MVYPQVDLSSIPGGKRNLILSVGRFTSTGLCKNQKDMLLAYGALREQGVSATDWQFVCAGAVHTDPESRQYFAECAALAERVGAIIRPNVSAAELSRLYAQAKIFWHAAGCAHEEDREPETAEHFGMVAVEAMANGCVPVVVDRGGQREIVKHGRNGYLWRTTEDLVARTVELSKHPETMATLAATAVVDAKQYSRTACIQAMDALLAPHLR